MTTVQTLADVDICNMGLSHLGISPTIQSINPPDNNQQAQFAAFWYSKTRDSLLKSAPWDFAYTSAVLASDASLAGASGTIGATYAFPGWPYAYVYPNDCLQAIAVTTYAGQRLGPAFWSSWWWPISGMTYAIPKIPYKIVQSSANPGQKMILCDLPSSSSSPIYLFYIQCVADTALFDPMFSDCFGFEMGWRMGMGMRSADPQKVQYCQAMAKQMKLEALAQVLNQSQQDQERDSPSTMARW